MSEPRNVLVVGGQKRCWEPLLEFLTACNCQIFEHWVDDTYLTARLPKQTQLVVIIASQISHILSRHAKTEAERAGVPRVYTDHRHSKFRSDLAKWGIKPAYPVADPKPDMPIIPERTEPLVPIQSVAVQVVQPAAKEHEMTVKTEAAAVPNKNVLRAQEKEAYVRQLLTNNHYLSSNDINKMVAEKFPGNNPARPGGMSKVAIAEIRESVAGIKAGPGGRFFNKKGELVEVPAQFRTAATPRVAHAPAANVEASNGRLERLVADLRAAMTAEKVESVAITANGQCSIKRTVTVEQTLNA